MSGNDVAALAEMFGHEERSTAIKAAGERFLAARRRKEQAERELKAANNELAEAQTELTRLLLAVGAKSCEIEGSKLTLVQSEHYSVGQGELADEPFRRWLYRHGGKHLLWRHLDARGFSHLCREVVVKGLRLYRTVQLFTKTTIQVREDENA